MSKHKQKIEKLFAHPISNNIDVKKLLHALEHYGAEVEQTKEHHVKIHLNGRTFAIPLPHREHTLPKETVVSLKHFLEEVGLTPDSLE